MGWADWLVLAVVFIWFVLAVAYLIRNKGKCSAGCEGDCAHCTKCKMK